MITTYALVFLLSLWVAVGVDRAVAWLWWIAPAVMELHRTKSLQQPLWLTALRVAFGFFSIAAFGALDHLLKIHRCIQCGHLVKVTLLGVRVPGIGSPVSSLHGARSRTREHSDE